MLKVLLLCVPMPQSCPGTLPICDGYRGTPGWLHPSDMISPEVSKPRVCQKCYHTFERADSYAVRNGTTDSFRIYRSWIKLYVRIKARERRLWSLQMLWKYRYQDIAFGITWVVRYKRKELQSVPNNMEIGQACTFLGRWVDALIKCSCLSTATL